MATLDSDSRVSIHGTLSLEQVFRSRKHAGCEGNLPDIDMLKVAKILKSLTGHTISRDNDKLQITLADVKFTLDRKHVCLLINTTNKKGAATVVKNTADNSRQEVSLQAPTDGYETSCHMVIGLESIETGSYKFVAEIIPKLNSSRIASLLNHALMYASDKYSVLYSLDKDLQLATENTPKSRRVKFKTVVALSYDPDEQFFSDLQDGVISNVKLIRHERSTFSFPDRPEVITAKKYIIELDTSRERADQIDWLRGISRSRLAKRFNQIAFSFNSESGQRSATIDLQNIKLSGLEKALVKKTCIDGFSLPLKDAYPKVYMEIKQKLLSVLD